MEVREEIWPRAKQYDIGPFWSFCRGIIVYGIANGIPDFLDIREKTKELHDEGLIVIRYYLALRGAENGVTIMVTPFFCVQG